ncbi:MAG: sugar phosphate isomerase/epimerase [Bryobacterales bacterium]|nr:sugar phosphate isomerase/epimerase [Bryobacterales bacterium]
MLPRRTLLQAPLAAGAAEPSMKLGMHQFTSAAAGYAKSLEGWAKAGITLVEPASGLVDDFLKTHTMAEAKRVLRDNGLTVISGAAGVTGLWDPNPKFADNLEAFRRRCEQFAELGAPLIYSPCVTAAKFTAEDYSRSVDNIRRVSDVAKQHGLKVGAEFVRNSTFLASLPTALRLHRQAAHSHFGIIFDCYHFWSGPSRLEDMDGIRPGEILHAHLNDTPDMPRELLDLQSRVMPGEGVAPLSAILKKLVARGYGGPISVELFWPRYQQADPFLLASEIQKRSQAVFRAAGV